MMLGYARVSREDQRLDVQVQALEQYGVDKKNIFVEKISALSKNRIEFKKCLAQLKHGDSLVGWKLDRLDRNLADLCSLASSLKEREVNLVVITERVNTRSAQETLYFHMTAAIAQFERDQLRERTIAGLKAAKKRGTFKTRPIAFEKENYDNAIEFVKNHPNATRRQVAEAVDMKIPHVTKHWDKIHAATPWPWGDNTIKQNKLKAANK